MLSWGFVPFSVFRIPEARFSRVYLARHLPSSGFRTLLTVSFLRNPPAVFQTGTLLGFSLQGFSPFTEPSNPLGLDPLHGIGAVNQNRLRSPPVFAPPSRLYSLEGFATVIDGVSHRKTAAALLVLSPSREFLPVAARSLRHGSPHGLHPCHNLQNRGPRTME